MDQDGRNIGKGERVSDPRKALHALLKRDAEAAVESTRRRQEEHDQHQREMLE